MNRSIMRKEYVNRSKKKKKKERKSYINRKETMERTGDGGKEKRRQRKTGK